MIGVIVQIINSLKRSAVQVIPSIICCHHIVQVICVRVIILSSCPSVLLICMRDRLLSDLCMNMLNNISDSLVLLFYCLYYLLLLLLYYHCL